LYRFRSSAFCSEESTLVERAFVCSSGQHPFNSSWRGNQCKKNRGPLDKKPRRVPPPNVCWRAPTVYGYRRARPTNFREQPSKNDHPRARPRRARRAREKKPRAINSKPALCSWRLKAASEAAHRAYACLRKTRQILDKRGQRGGAHTAAQYRELSFRTTERKCLAVSFQPQTTACNHVAPCRCRQHEGVQQKHAYQATRGWLFVPLWSHLVFRHQRVLRDVQHQLRVFEVLHLDLRWTHRQWREARMIQHKICELLEVCTTTKPSADCRLSICIFGLEVRETPA